MAGKKKALRYPYLDGCYVEEKYERTQTRKYLQATINLRHYKGAMLLSVTPETSKRHKGECACPFIQYPAAWLRGDDLDALIAGLREAKRVWLKAYRKTERIMRRSGMLPKERRRGR